MEPTITSEVVVAYSQCPRKAYLLLFSLDKGEPHEYERVLDQQRQENQERYLDRLKHTYANRHSSTVENLHNGSEVLINVRLQADGFEAQCGVLTKVEGKSAFGKHRYEPTIFVGTYSISKDQKLELIYAGYVLGRLQHKAPRAGRIIAMDGKSHTVKLGNSSKDLIPLLEPLQDWTTVASPEPPPVILNKHCPLCPFQRWCQAQAEQQDNLSLLDGISTSKIVKKYERKGIFTVNQLSYLYRPKRRRKRSRQSLAPKHDVALQALVIRKSKIFIQKAPELSRHPVEIFLDIEGIPDQQLYYLLGVLICEGGSCTYHALWADTISDEPRVWQQFLTLITQFPLAPIYHYGNYELRAISKLGQRYQTDIASMTERLVNINTHIYGKVYFPLRSNRLKEIGNFLGASWTSHDASGLRSLVWRYHWEKTGNIIYRQHLITYNEEDCRALKILTDTLSVIKDREDSISDIDHYIHTKKSRSSNVDNPLHEQLETILKFAHSSYNKNRIHFKKTKQNDGGEDEKVYKRVGTPHRKRYRKPTRIFQIPQITHCPTCGCDTLSASERTTERMLVDLTFTKHGVRKSIAKYWAYKAHCPTCRRNFAPPNFAVKGRPQLFGAGFKIWVAYLRIALRLPYGNIKMIIRDMFNEDLADSLIIQCIQEVSRYNSQTEKDIFAQILESPFIHIDETQINIDNVNQYIWVFTNGTHVVFKHTETREAGFLHDFLDDYGGTLISDFFSGYDSLHCRHQKCWVHLIREENLLFTFLEYDGIPWHNNTAESAIRHLPLQARISGVFHTSLIREYLILLGIRQTCRFQGKSFLKFLLSGEQDVDSFKGSSKNNVTSFMEDLAPPWKKAAETR